jgi:hypothetical protein
MLRALEAAAARMGCGVMRLPAGCRQQAALRLYEVPGFARIGAFGPYAADPTSVCFEKRLSLLGAPAG